MAECSVEGCERPVLARGWCSLHYGRWQRKGDTGDARAERTYRKKACRRCGREFQPSGGFAVYCSRECQYGTFECEHCGETFVGGPSDSRGQTNRFCSQRCHYAHGHAGRRSVNREGYVVLNLGVEAEGVRPDGRILEHRYVMQEHLGRALRDDEVVHHKNGNRADNRLRNLELWSTRHPKGQRVEELVEFAKEIIALYG